MFKGGGGLCEALLVKKERGIEREREREREVHIYIYIYIYLFMYFFIKYLWGLGFRVFGV